METWRRGDEDLIMPHPKELGECIDRITKALDNLTSSSRVISESGCNCILSDMAEDDKSITCDHCNPLNMKKYFKEFSEKTGIELSTVTSNFPVKKNNN